MIKGFVSNKLIIRLFGEFHLFADGASVSGLNADRPQSLLAYLLLHRGIPQSRQRLAFLLWPDSTEGQARTNLRNLLHTLRHSLPSADIFLSANSATVEWVSTAPFDLDVAQFEAALAQAHESSNSKMVQQCLETAVSLYQGDLLPGNYDDWIIPIREELRQRYLAALRQLVSLLEEQGDYRTAARYCQRQIQQDPYDETASIQLMRLQALAGDRAGVRRSYQALTNILRRELGVEPALSTQKAYSELLRLEPESSPQLVATAVLPEWQPQPLPTPSTQFVGRETELDEIAQRLRDPNCRLLTILGLGGMGKTRLALQTAVNKQACYPQGAAFVSLAGLQSAELLASAVADTLQFRFASSEDPKQQLFKFLHQKEMLLVLDNFEHLLSKTTKSEYGGEDWLAELLQAAPTTKIIVTSRQRLDLQEEWIFEIQGMNLPQISSDVVLTDYSAVALFCQTALRVDAHFELCDENLAHVAHICHLVGGMPLGIELAASWVRTLSCAEISREIERGLGILQTDIRNMPLRHRSMQAVFDHSWQLLSADEQLLLARLSIFKGGFSREAAVEVADTHLAALSALVDKSLLQRTSFGRFMLHELVRQFAAARLHASSEVEQAVRHQHAVYYLTLLQTHLAQLQSPQQNTAITTLMADIDNIRSAWDQAVAENDFALLRRAAFACWYLYELRNYFQEGERRLSRTATIVEKALNLASMENYSSEHQEMRALLGELWAYLGFLNIHMGNSQAAFDLTLAAVELLLPEDSLPSPAYALCFHVMVLRTKSRYDEAIERSQIGLKICRNLGLNWLEAIFLATMGATAHDLGDYTKAYDLLNQAISISRAIGDPRLTAYIGNLLSRTVQLLGRPSEVESLLKEILLLSTESEDRLAIGMVLEQMARMAHNARDEQQALALYEECVAMYRKSGDIFHISQSLTSYGQFLLEIGSYEKARHALVEACQMGGPLGANVPVLEALTGLAALCLHDSAWEKAYRIICYIQGHRFSSSEALRQAGLLKKKALQKLSSDQVAMIEAEVDQQPFNSWLLQAIR